VDNGKLIQTGRVCLVTITDFITLPIYQIWSNPVKSTWLETKHCARIYPSKPL